ncbi:MAG: hypothetical protein GY708_29420 [Actinomycetia bacterium]|nr:hypothetical protein [Actinomycetes bacterium]MCP4960522.1 hypothetical protein [Actinomycetes bacterium]
MESSEGADDTMARSNDTIAAWFVGAWLVSAIGAAALFLVGTWRAYSTIGPEEGVVAEVGIGFPFGLSWDFSASNADLSLLVAAAAGALGALTYAARGLAFHISEDDFGSEWTAWYVIQPILGATLGAITTAAVSAGFITGGLESGEIRPAGVLVLGFVAGMFVKQVTEKFKELVSVFFGRPQSKTDQIQARIAAVRSMEHVGDITPEAANDKVADLMKRI